MSRKECEKDICDKFKQIEYTDDKLTRIYCEYVLCLNKIYVDRIVDGFYEQCENYLKEYSSNEEREKQFIKSYETDLALKGNEICAEVEPFTNNELRVKKAVVYCENTYILKDINQKLVDKCKNYLEEVNKFYSYKNTFVKINNDRKIEQEWLDMRNKRLKKI